MAGRGMLQLFVFEGLPRAMPPLTDLTGLQGTRLVRAVQRAAWHPWRDAAFWRGAAKRVAEGEQPLSGKELAQVCLAFRRVDFPSSELADYCAKYVAERKPKMTIFQLAAVGSLLSSSGGDGAQAAVQQIADEVCGEWRQKEPAPWIAWKVLVCSAAAAGVAHRPLFSAASPQLLQGVRLMTGRDAVDVCNAYATFRFRHHALLKEMHRLSPLMGLSYREICDLQAAFGHLDFDVPLLQGIQELHRAGAFAGHDPRDARSEGPS